MFEFIVGFAVGTAFGGAIIKWAYPKFQAWLKRIGEPD